MKFFSARTAMSLLSVLGFAQAAQAHVSFVANNAYAGKTYVAALQIPHGCSDSSGEHYDTTQVEVIIPPGFSGVRPADSAFGPATVERDMDGNVSKIIWTKTAPAAEDYLYNRLEFQGKPAVDTALSALEFVTTQRCSEGDPQVWEGASVPSLKINLVRAPGWNKYTAQMNIDAEKLKAYFTDAVIVWYRDAAYSANPVTDGMISEKLKVIPLGGEFWVKY